LLTLRDRDDLMSSWSLSSALDFPVPDMPVTRILLIIRRLGKASCALPLWARSIDVHARVRPLDPHGNSEVSGQIPARTRRQGRSGAEARDPQFANGREDRAHRTPIAEPAAPAGTSAWPPTPCTTAC
jgi:hypothetical protein